MKIYFESKYDLNCFSEILGYLGTQFFVGSTDDKGYYERWRIRETAIELRIIQPTSNISPNRYLEQVKGFCDLLMDLNE